MKKWQLWAVAAPVQVLLKEYVATIGAAEDDMAEWSEGFPRCELHLRNEGRFLVAYKNGKVMQRGDVR